MATPVPGAPRPSTGRGQSLQQTGRKTPCTRLPAGGAKEDWLPARDLPETTPPSRRCQDPARTDPWACWQEWTPWPSHPTLGVGRGHWRQGRAVRVHHQQQHPPGPLPGAPEPCRCWPPPRGPSRTTHGSPAPPQLRPSPALPLGLRSPESKGCAGAHRLCSQDTGTLSPGSLLCWATSTSRSSGCTVGRPGLSTGWAVQGCQGRQEGPKGREQGDAWPPARVKTCPRPCGLSPRPAPRGPEVGRGGQVQGSQCPASLRRPQPGLDVLCS